MVVVVPPGSPIAAGFARARDELASGASSVRLVGRDVTSRTNWPPWTHDAEHLVVTEIDAYLPVDRQPLWDDMAAALRRWLSEVFDGTLPGVRPEDAMWGSATLRVFLPAFVAWPYVVGLTEHHAHDRVICVDATWPGSAPLGDRVTRRGGTFVSAAPARGSGAFALRAAGWFAVSGVAAIAHRALEFHRERPARQRLNELRARHAEAPRVWLVVFGDWPRSCRHVIEGVGSAGRERGARVGILLQTSLRAGLRRENDMHAPSGDAIFPTLDEPALAGNVAAVDQCASAETWHELLANRGRSLAKSGRVLARLLRRGRFADLGVMRFDLAPHVSALARLSTFDLLRGNETIHATQRLLARRNFSGADVIWPHASLVSEIIPDLLLQRAGATTYELIHGSLFLGLDLLTFGRTASSVRIFWTAVEPALHAHVTRHQRTLGGYVPRPLPRVSRGPRPAGPIRVLAVSNYACPNPAVGEGLALAYLQDRFLQAVAGAIGHVDSSIVLRWRPHPSDDRGRVEATRALHAPPGMEMSLEPGALGRDLGWADILVTSISSSITEALCHPLPILVHRPPTLDWAGALSLFAPERLFQDGTDLAQKLRLCIEAVEAIQHGVPGALGPEDDLRRRFFGPTGVPASLASIFWPERK